MSEFASITNALIACDGDTLNTEVDNALAGGALADAILNDGLIAAMDIVGDRMQEGDMFIPEVLMAAQIMGTAVEKLKPLLADEASSSHGKVLIGTVKGDLHDIGKNLVSMMVESAGFEVRDIGVDVAPETFISEIKSFQPDVVALSALLTTTMPMMKSTIEAIAEAGVRGSVKLIVGGAPVTDSFARDIGADGYAPDAGSASKLAKTLLQ